ncbi:type I-E CRISPR-associated protein Cas6/Cse3/CasE [Geoalkalibacter halelectricus]|uniref:type I-E CRISPR-associated protein Cas6/Cse3/CasE n=1 Tax=Geoalkalibacter halelectricus TaxID=2847045 RepID=UPI003D1C8218
MYFSRIRIRPDVRDLHLLIGGNGYGAHQLLWKLFPDGGEGRTFLFREEIAREQLPFHKGIKGEPIYYLVSGPKPVADHPVFAVESKAYAPKISTGERLAFRLRANPTIARKTEGKKNSVRHDVVMDAQFHLLREIAGKTNSQQDGDKSKIKGQLISAWQQLSDPKSIEEELRGIILENERFATLADMPMSEAKLLDTAVKSRTNKVLETWFCGKGERLGFALVRDQAKQRLKFQAEGYRWHALPKKGKSAGFSSVDFEGEIEVVDAELFSRALYEGIGPAKGFGCGLMLVRRV